MFELYDGKLSRTALRRESGSNARDLSGNLENMNTILIAYLIMLGFSNQIQLTEKWTSFIDKNSNLVGSKDTNELKIKFENYMDINGFQVVLTTDEKINCKGRIEVEGIVDIVDLGGQMETKESYKNIWIKVMNFKCDE